MKAMSLTEWKSHFKSKGLRMTLEVIVSRERVPNYYDRCEDRLIKDAEVEIPVGIAISVFDKDGKRCLVCYPGDITGESISSSEFSRV